MGRLKDEFRALFPRASFGVCQEEREALGTSGANAMTPGSMTPVPPGFHPLVVIPARSRHYKRRAETSEGAHVNLRGQIEDLKGERARLLLFVRDLLLENTRLLRAKFDLLKAENERLEAELKNRLTGEAASG